MKAYRMNDNLKPLLDDPAILAAAILVDERRGYVGGIR